MKKILSLIICTVMVLPTLLTACSDGYRTSDSTAAKATTITITTICEEGTTQEAITLVQNAINSLTESQYNTHVVLRMLTADEYDEFVLSKAEYNYLHPSDEVIEDDPEPDEKEEGKPKEEEVEVQEDANGQQFYISGNGDKHILDENGRGHVVYPDAGENQLDIVLINSLTLYDKLAKGYEVTEGEGKDAVVHYVPYLAELGTEEIPYGTLLDKYVPGYDPSPRKTLSIPFSADAAEKRSYAIPNNTYFGSYRYLLINKELFDKYQYDAGTVNGMGDLLPFLNDLVENNEPVSPIYSYAGYHWQSVFGEDSVVSIPVANSYDREVVQKPDSIFASTAYREELLLLRKLQMAGCTWSEEEDYDPSTIDVPFGAAMVRGDSTIPKTYEEQYYVKLCEKPQLTSEMFEGMYGISASCRYPARAMEILTLFSTNADIANLLSYGVEGAHYDLTPAGVVTNRSDDYRINIRYAGNMFLLRQNDEMDEKMLRYSANDWELAKLQNADLVLNPYCGFEVKPTDAVTLHMNNVKALSESIFAELASYGESGSEQAEGGAQTFDKEAYDLFLQGLSDKIRNSPEVISALEAKTTGGIDTPYQQYYSFFLARSPKRDS